MLSQYSDQIKDWTEAKIRTFAPDGSRNFSLSTVYRPPLGLSWHIKWIQETVAWV